MYPGQHMSIEDNIFYAKRNIVDSIWKEANIEGIDITFPATKAVFEGAKIANLTQDQTTVINNADVIKKSGDLFATARAMLLDACVCLLYRQGGDSMSMQGLVDLLQNDISHNEDQDMPSIKAAYDKIEADGATVEEDLGLKRYRMFQAIAYGETAISVELDLYAKLSAMVDRPLVG